MRYWPFYCEENIWHLCADAGRGDRVAFISNSSRQVPLLGQRAVPAGEIVIWDYHVVLFRQCSPPFIPRGGHCPPRGWEVWDLDHLFGAPMPAAVYLDRTFALAVSPLLDPPKGTVPEFFAPRFRLLPAAQYRRELRSDRRHMLATDGTYLHPPPPWPAIGEGSNLMRFVDMETAFFGEVRDLEGLRRALEGPPESQPLPTG